MYGAPLVVCQRDDGRTLQTRQHVDNLLQASLRGIHADVLLVLGILHGLEAEQHLLQRSALVGTQVLVAYEQCLAVHHDFHFAQVVADQRRTAGHNVEDAVSQSDARADFHGTCDDVNLALNTLFLHIVAQYVGVGGGNLLAVEPVDPTILNLLGNGQRQAALRETKTRNDVSILATLYKFVFAHYADVGNS